MTDRLHVLWVQELLASRGLVVTVNDSRMGEGVLTFTAGGRSTTRTIAQMLNTSVYTLADELQQELA